MVDQHLPAARRAVPAVGEIGLAVALELLRAAAPKISRVAVLMNPLNPSDSLVLEQINGAAFASGIRVLPPKA